MSAFLEYLGSYWDFLTQRGPNGELTFDVLGAFWVNIQLTFWSGLLALLIGVVVVAMRISPIASLRITATAYTNIFRDIPLTAVILMMWLVVWTQLGVTFGGKMITDFFILAVVGLGLYHGSFMAEALRSGVNTVPLGQAEAARAIGLTFMQSARMIVLPQAFRGAVAPIGNTLIALIKNTTVASVGGVSIETSSVMSGMIEFGPQFIFLVFLTFALGYVVIVIPVGMLSTHLSHKLAVKR
ncbi:MAG: amino acid ABC transporter permease [Propionibacteriaceae bacterium]|jgi:glutamate transport system permease protein|nr:amino acid ABC transporter permease [Propionibacteriaceae bacterium]